MTIASFNDPKKVKIEIIERKGENAVIQVCFPGASKGVIVWEWVNQSVRQLCC